MMYLSLSYNYRRKIWAGEVSLFASISTEFRGSFPRSKKKMQVVDQLLSCIIL
jgi:hypothetical protein